MSCGTRGTELVRILEASSESLRNGGAPVEFSESEMNGRGHLAKAIAPSLQIKTPKILANRRSAEKKRALRASRKTQIKIVLNGNGHNGNGQNGNGH